MSSPHTGRLTALDRMRGLVMVLMTVDHASDVFNRDALAADTWFFNGLGADLAPDGTPWAFLTRWVSHLCAPTFVFLAGTSLVLALARRRQQGASEGELDRYLLRRGALLVLCEVWMSIGFQVPVLQVLSAIGLSMMAMALLRRLPAALLLALGLGWCLLGEWVVEGLGWFQFAWAQPVEHGFLVPVMANLYLPEGLQQVLLGLFVWHYPPVSWLAVMVLGWCFGRWLLAQDPAGLERRVAARLLLLGCLSLTIFLAVRWVDGYGNFRLTRTDDTWLRWLQVSKYPPSLAFLGLELGLMCLCLAGFFLWPGSATGRPRGPLAVLGRNALFFYLLHVHLILVLGFLLFRSSFLVDADQRPFGVEGAWGGALVVVALLYPLCIWREARRRRAPAA